MDNRLSVVNPRVEEYLDRISPPRDSILSEMEEIAARRGFPIVGPLVGALLHLTARAIGAGKVLELGSGFGYSAIWFARAVGPGGKVVATESSPENAELGKGFLERSGLSGRVDYRIGNALEIARGLPGPFDVVFNDIDKQDYPRVLETARRLLRPGGLLICDNMLWRGLVVEESSDPATRGVRELNRLLHASGDFVTSLLPLRDGVTLSLKLG